MNVFWLNWWMCAWYRRCHCRAWIGADFRMCRGWLSCTDNSRLRTHLRLRAFRCHLSGMDVQLSVELSKVLMPHSTCSQLVLRSEWMEAGCQQTNLEILVRTPVIGFIFALRLYDDWLTSLCYWAQQFAFRAAKTTASVGRRYVSCSIEYLGWSCVRNSATFMSFNGVYAWTNFIQWSRMRAECILLE